VDLAGLRLLMPMELTDPLAVVILVRMDLAGLRLLAPPELADPPGPAAVVAGISLHRIWAAQGKAAALLDGTCMHIQGRE